MPSLNNLLKAFPASPPTFFTYPPNPKKDPHLSNTNWTQNHAENTTFFGPLSDWFNLIYNKRILKFETGRKQFENWPKTWKPRGKLGENRSKTGPKYTCVSSDYQPLKEGGGGIMGPQL